MRDHTVGVLPCNELQYFIYKNNRERYFYNCNPLFDRQRSDLENSLSKEMLNVYYFETIFSKDNQLQQQQLTERKSTSRMTKWRLMEMTIAPINHLLHQGGITSSDWFSEMLR